MVKWKCFAFLPACSEGGCRCVWLFVPSQETLQGWRACSACSRTLAHWTSITWFPLFLSQLFIPSIDFPAWRFFFTLFPFCFCYSPPLRLPLSLFLTSRDKHTHTTHTDSFLSKTYFRSYDCVVWKESKCSLVYLCFFSPQIHRQDAVLLTSNGFDVFFLIDVSVTWAILAVYDKSAYWLFT